MKVYARQVAPEYQESPLFLGDEFYPEGIVIDGNSNYISHKTKAYEKILNYLDDAFYELEKIYAKEGWYKNVTECIMDYFEPEFKEKYTSYDIVKWKKVINDYHNCSYSEKWRPICAALSLITGRKYEFTIIRGCCQSDWQEIYYPSNEYTKESIDIFEMEYFNTGTEWIINDEEVPERPEDICGVSIYCYGWNNDQIRQEIADYSGCAIEDVVLYRHAGFIQTNTYEMIA